MSTFQTEEIILTVRGITVKYTFVSFFFQTRLTDSESLRMRENKHQDGRAHGR